MQDTEDLIMEENDLAKLCGKYELPPMKYSKKLKPGDGTIDRTTGEIHLSESLRFTREEELLRVAFHEAGHYHTRSFQRDVLPLYIAAVFAVLLGFCLIFPQLRDFAPSYVPFFGLLGSILTFETARKHWEIAANQWAKAHWPHDLSTRGEVYL